MKQLLFVFCQVIFSFSAVTAMAQIEEADQTLIFQPFAGGLVETKSLPPGKVLGSLFLDDNWQTGDLMLKNGKILKQIPLKYNLENNELLIKTEQGLKSVYSDKIKQFSWISTTDGSPQRFVNVDNFEVDDKAGAGFFKILLEGPYTLATKTSVEFYKPNYSQMYDAGNQDGRFNKTERLYYIVDGKKAYAVPRKKKLFLQIFGDWDKEIEKYMKDHNYQHKNMAQLIFIFHYYNSLNP